MKICGKCKIPKEDKEFSKNSLRKGFLDWMCKVCKRIAGNLRWSKKSEEFKNVVRARNKKWREDNANRIEIRRLKRQYGLEVGELDKLVLEQNNRCAICCNTFRSNKSRHIDHDHLAKKVRGVLCQKCNHGLGLFDDSPARLRAAAFYLDKAAK